MEQFISCLLGITRTCSHEETVHYSGSRNGNKIDLFIEKESKKPCSLCKGDNMLVTKVDSFSKKYSDGSITGVVLAQTDTQCITWQYTTFDGNDLIDSLRVTDTFETNSNNCYNGHYFTDIATAVDDMNKRIGRL